jgi:ATP-binding cassette, subfamily B, bacterial
MIEALPQGYDTLVYEGGQTFSEGEKLRLSIARALLRDSSILILDEPTSALDAETEARVMQGLNHLRRMKTTFVIAHRLSTVRNADIIVLLKDGRIAEKGTFDELAALDGEFASLLRTQFGSLEKTHGKS